jgi:HlyD family secretion protein
VSGEIVRLYVEEGDTVRRGDPLIQLRDEDYQSGVEQARAQLLEARASLSGAQADSIRRVQTLKRQERLAGSEAIPEADLQNAQTAYQRAVARVEASRSQVARAQADLDDARELRAKTRLEAPIDAVVTRLNVEEGERVVGTMRVAGTEIMTLGTRKEAMEFRVQVPEKEVRFVSPGDSAVIETEAYDDRLFKGVVAEVASSPGTGSAQVAGGSQQTEYRVRVRLTTPHVLATKALDRTQPSKTGTPMQTAGASRAAGPAPAPESPLPVMRPGMTGTVRIMAREASDVLVVPRAAVTTRNLNNLDSATVARSASLLRPSRTGDREDLRTVVFVKSSDGAQMHEVDTGLKGERFIEIARGLQPGDEVIVGPEAAVANELAPGSALNRFSYTPIEDL